MQLTVTANKASDVVSRNADVIVTDFKSCNRITRRAAIKL